MRTFIATLGKGKGTWGKVKRISGEDWDKIVLLGNSWAKDTFKSDLAYEWILLEDEKDVCQQVMDIIENLPEDLGDVFVNVTSGSGSEHLALISALISNNKPFKTVCVCDDGITYYGE
ncbi:MAG TPA: hypothetical protein PK718_01000 [Candidatus Methanofastidiosa archaeon]|nr:hypothetical protein [Candidatus Methanofastidiosa archaeon]